MEGLSLDLMGLLGHGQGSGWVMVPVTPVKAVKAYKCTHGPDIKLQFMLYRSPGDAEFCMFSSTDFLGDDNDSRSAHGMTVIPEIEG